MRVLQAVAVSAVLCSAVCEGAPAQTPPVSVVATMQARADEGFSRIGSVRELVGDTLRVAVQDPIERRVVLVNLRDGTRRVLGRAGAGPSEYRAPGRLFGGLGGTILFADPGQRKLLRIAADGGSLDDIRLPQELLGAFPTLLGTDARGRLLFSARGVEGGRRDSMPLLLWEPGGATTAILARVPTGIGVSRAGGSGGATTFSRPSALPFAASPAYGLLPNGLLALVSPDPYRIVLVAETRTVAGPITQWRPIPVTAAEREAITRARSARPAGFGEGGVAGSGPARLPEEEFPATKPPFTGQEALSIAPDGMIWIATHRPFTDSIPRYDVFDDTGVLRRQVRLPARRTLVGFGRRALYLAYREADTDLVYLERWAAP